MGERFRLLTFDGRVEDVEDVVMVDIGTGGGTAISICDGKCVRSDGICCPT